MNRPNFLPALLALPLLLAACGSPGASPSAQQSATESLRQAQTPGLTLSVPDLNHAAGVVTAPFAMADFSQVRPGAVPTRGTLDFAAQAVTPVTPDASASFSADNLGVDTDLPLPATAGVNARFLMADVPGRRVVASLRLKYRGGRLFGASTLRLTRAISETASENSVTEAFKLDELSGVTELVGAWHGREPVVLPDLSETLEHAAQDGTGVRLKLVFLRADQNAYDAQCKTEGGDVNQGFCSFVNKVNKPLIGPQVVQVNSRFVTWNLGNSAYTCGGAFNYKLCYISTFRRIQDTINGFISNNKPAVMYFQEMWHGKCKYNNVNDTSKLCSSSYPYSSFHSILPLLGSTNAWNYACSNPEDVPSASLVINGYECIAVDPNKFSMPSYATPTPIQPACSASYDPNSKYDGRDTGFQVMTASPVGRSGVTFKLINGHLVGTNQSDCRALQMNTLNSTAGLRTPNVTLIAGDFNTDPNTETAIGGATFRNLFTAYGSAPYDDSKLGKELDNPGQATAYYVGGYSPSLDHVISNRMGGSCTRGPNFDGTDHVWTDCNLYTLYTQ